MEVERHLGSSPPTPLEWSAFLQQRLLLIGVTLSVVGAVFFVAANWGTLPFAVRLAIVVVPLAVSAIGSGQLGRESLGGRAAGLFAGLLIGPALALFGQHYQTGADTWELFAGWAALLIPFALFSRFMGTWIFWLVLVALTACLNISQELGGKFFSEFAVVIGIGIALLFVVGAAIVEGARKGGVSWCQARWGPRTMGVIALIIAWSLAAFGIVSLRLIGDSGAVAEWQVAFAIGFFFVLCLGFAAVYVFVIKDRFLITATLSTWTLWFAGWTCIEIVKVIDNIFALFFCGGAMLFEMAILAIVLRALLSGGDDD